jgi:monoamine oxidase
MNDFIVIGAGIGGIYVSYKYLHNYKYIIVDKNDYIGGRAKTKLFHKKMINLGAGVIADSNKYLLKLCDDLKLKVNTFETKMEHQTKNVSKVLIDEIINNIKKTYNDNKNEIDTKNYTFIEFLYIYFDSDYANLILEIADYGDFHNSQVYNVITQYPIEELITYTAKMHYIDGGWNKLFDKLLEKINKNNIKLNTKIVKITKHNDFFTIIDNNNNFYISKRVIICSDISIKNVVFENIYGINDFLNCISSIPFLRIYTYHENIKNFNSSIKTNNLLSKIIKINDNILMSVYNDSHNALIIYKMFKKLNKNDFLQSLYKMILKTIPNDCLVSSILDYELTFWKNGIHYYNTNNKKINYNIDQKKLIDQGICFFGEMVSDRQGWIEGVIRNVDNYSELLNK